MNKILIGIGIILLGILGVLIVRNNNVVGQFGGVSNYLDTSSSNITHATTTINTTSTQVFSSITKIGQLINNSTNTITCSMDATGITAASSTVAANRGIIVPNQASSTIYSAVMFGECYPGAVNCYAHKGAVNCLIVSQSVVTKWSK